MPTPDQWLDIARKADAAGDAEGARAAIGYYQDEIDKNSERGGGGEGELDARAAMSGLTAEAGSFDEAVKPPAERDLLGEANAGLSSFFDNIPIVGPAIRGGVERAAAGTASLIYDKPYEEMLAAAQGNAAADKEAHPVADTAGMVAGNVAPYMIGAGIPAAATRLGMTGTTGAKIGNSLLSGSVISAADTAARGGDLGDSTKSGVVGGLLSAAFPAVGAGVKAGWKGIADGIKRAKGSSDVGDDILRKAFGQDLKDGKIMSLADEATAKANGNKVINADRGGDTVKALARDVANKVPGMWGDMTTFAEKRLTGQSDRLIDKFSAMVGGRIDDVAVKDQINAAAKKANKANYTRAYKAPGADMVWDKTLRRITTAPLVKKAIAAAEEESANRAVIEGGKAVRNPFVTLADGSLARNKNMTPTLEFWDHVKRNLDKVGQTDKANAAEAKSLAKLLREHLTTRVPEYANARGTAERFFDAEDAVDAGRKFFEGGAKNINEAKKALAGMSAEERAGLALGVVSAAVDKAKGTRDHRELMRVMFDAPAAREKLQMAFGTTKAKEIEVLARVELALDKFRGAFGGSNTTKQALQAVGVGLAPAAAGGLGGGALGAAASGGDPRTIIASAIAGATANWGRRHMAKVLAGADEKILREVGEKLLSEDPEVIRKLMTSALGSPAQRQAITTLGMIADAAGKASSGSTARELTVPVEPRAPMARPAP